MAGQIRPPMGWLVGGALVVVVSGVKLGRDYTKMLTQCFLQFQNVKIPIQHLWAILLFFHRSHWTNYIMSNRIYESVMSCQSHVKEKVSQIFLNCAGHSKLPNQLLEYPIPPPPLSVRHKKYGWRYLGNEKSYQRSAGVKTTGKNLSVKKKHLKNLENRG